MSIEDKLLPTYRGCVNAWECDEMGHMNVQFYVAKSSDALAQLANAIGITPGYTREQERTLRVMADRIQFRREMHAGALMHIRSGIRGANPSGIRFFSEMINSETGEVSAFFESMAHHMDLATGERVPMPDRILARATELAGDFPDHPAPLPTATPSLPDAVTPTMYDTFRGGVNTWECNEFGSMERRFHIARFSDAASHIFRELGVNQEMRRERNLGTAALDYRITYRKPLRAGDAIIVKSGVLELRDKTVRFGHHLIDTATDEIACSIEIIAVFFDLALRKSVPLPDEIRKGAAGHMIFETA